MSLLTRIVQSSLAIALLGGTAFGQGHTNALPAGAPAPASVVPLSKIPQLALKQLPRDDIFDYITGSILKRVGDNSNAFLGFINDLHLRPIIFQATDRGGSQNDDTGFGLEFDYQKALASHVINPECINPIGISMTIEARGQVTMDADENPNNLIEAGGGFHMFQGVGGIDPHYRPTPEAQRKLDDLIDAAALHDEAARQKAITEFIAHMAPHFFYDVEAHGRIETDQQLDNRQYVYGGQLSMVFRDWRPKSDIGWFNLFDYPFAAFRKLARQENWEPSGRTFPSVVIGVDAIDPSDNGERLAVDPNDDLYPRLRIEVAFKTPLIHLEKETLFFSAGYRHYSEFHAPGAIKAANDDYSNYFVATIDLPLHFNVSYSTGRLPLDQSNDQVYAVGWNVNF